MPIWMPMLRFLVILSTPKRTLSKCRTIINCGLLCQRVTGSMFCTWGRIRIVSLPWNWHGSGAIVIFLMHNHYRYSKRSEWGRNNVARAMTNGIARATTFSSFWSRPAWLQSFLTIKVIFDISCDLQVQAWRWVQQWWWIIAQDYNILLGLPFDFMHTSHEQHHSIRYKCPWLSQFGPKESSS